MTNPHSDLGPTVQRETIAGPGGVVIREPRIDVIKATALGEISRGVTWLPLRLHVRGQITMAQLSAISRYADLRDLAAGVAEARGPVSGSSPWLRCAVTDTSLAARITLDRIRRTLDASVLRVVEALMIADSQTEAARRMGCHARSVPKAAQVALDALDAALNGGRSAP